MFAEQLQAARNAAGLSQSQAALAIGRSASTYRKWEQGVNTPHAQIQALALEALKSAKLPKRKAENDLALARAGAENLNEATGTQDEEKH